MRRQEDDELLHFYDRDEGRDVDPLRRALEAKIQLLLFEAADLGNSDEAERVYDDLDYQASLLTEDESTTFHALVPLLEVLSRSSGDLAPINALKEFTNALSD